MGFRSMGILSGIRIVFETFGGQGTNEWGRRFADFVLGHWLL